MSRILRNVIDAPVISIGEKHLDLDKEKVAYAKLQELFPKVSVMTDPDGAKYIPIQEIYRFEEVLIGEMDRMAQEGFDQGHKEGLRKGLLEGTKVLQQLDGAIKDAVTQREILLEDAKRKILDLVVKISQKVTFDAIQVDPETTLSMINGVIDTLVDRSRLTIKVNPQHLPIVEQNIDKFLKGDATIKEIKIEADPRVKYGGCFIETPNGDIDARLESQFEVITDVLESEEVEE